MYKDDLIKRALDEYWKISPSYVIGYRYCPDLHWKLDADLLIVKEVLYHKWEAPEKFHVSIRTFERSGHTMIVIYDQLDGDVGIILDNKMRVNVIE